MPTDLDRLLTESLQERANAGAPIDPAPIMRVAVANGRRIRTRRRVVTAVLTIAVCCGIVVTGTLVPRRSDSTSPVRPAPQPTGSPVVIADLDRLPDAAGEPGATVRPDLVGTDPSVLHFSMDDLAVNVTNADSYSMPGYETASVYGPGVAMLVTLTHSRSTFPRPESMTKDRDTTMSEPVDATVDGAPGKISSSQVLVTGDRLFSVTWRPAGDLWANVEVRAADLGRAVAFVERISFDQAKRCVMPFRIGRPPAGSTLLSCELDLSAEEDGDIFAFGSQVFGAGKHRLEIHAENEPAYIADQPGPLRAGPYRVSADPDGKTWTTMVRPIWFTASMQTPKTPYSQDQVLDVLGSITMAPDYQDPGTW